MSVFYEEVRTAIDPEQSDIDPDGAVHQDISVIMTQHAAPIAPERRLEAAIVTLEPRQARELAFELLAAAEAAERTGGRR